MLYQCGPVSIATRLSSLAFCVPSPCRICPGQGPWSGIHLLLSFLKSGTSAKNPLTRRSASDTPAVSLITGETVTCCRQLKLKEQ
jgi:hypothetical protein